MRSPMKKLISLALALTLLLALFACGRPSPVPNPPLVLGEKYLLDLDYEQALLQFEQAIVIEPKNPRGYLGKADALLHLDRQAEAAETVGTAAKQCRPQRAALNEAKAAMGKSFVDACIALATAYETLGWREIALALLRRVCEELPEDSRLKDALDRLLTAPAQTEPPKSSKTAKTTTEAPKKPVKRMIYYSANGTITGTQTNEYDTKGQRIRIDIQHSDGVSSYFTMQYNDKGQEIRQENHWSDGRSSYSTSEYNDKGQVVRREGRGYDGTSDYATYEYEYDAEGRVIRQITTSSSAASLASTSYLASISYEYNAVGQVVRQEMRYSDGGSTYHIYEYNTEGLLVRMNQYWDGQLTEYILCEY